MTDLHEGFQCNHHDGVERDLCTRKRENNDLRDDVKNIYSTLSGKVGQKYFVTAITIIFAAAAGLFGMQMKILDKVDTLRETVAGAVVDIKHLTGRVDEIKNKCP